MSISQNPFVLRYRHTCENSFGITKYLFHQNDHVSLLPKKPALCLHWVKRTRKELKIGNDMIVIQAPFLQIKKTKHLLRSLIHRMMFIPTASVMTVFAISTFHKRFSITISLSAETTDPGQEDFLSTQTKQKQYTISNFIIVHHKKESKEIHANKNFKAERFYSTNTLFTQKKSFTTGSQPIQRPSSRTHPDHHPHSHPTHHHHH